MSKQLIRAVAVVTATALALPPPGALAQPKPALTAPAASEFNLEQLDAMLAPIALYPDDLLTQILMAATYPLQVVEASRWLAQGDNKSLKGDALAKALEKQAWDPSVKSLVPFPQVLAMLNDNLQWMQQLGYAMATQQAAVLDSVQRLRRQAEKAGSLKTTEQQTVSTSEGTIVIEPASTETVYVPVYQPANVYGEWPYPDYPPVYIPPPAAYYPAAYAPGYVWGTALAFAAGAAIVGGLWGWARPRWGYGSVSVNPLRYNSINVNRAQISSSTWRSGAAGIGGRPVRAPGGPVGLPARPSQLPANAIGRGNVQVPRGAIDRPNVIAGGGVQRPGGGVTARPPQAAQLPAVQRPNAGQLPARTQAPTVVRGSPAGSQRPTGAFGSIGDGGRAAQYGARGAQSSGFHQSAAARGGYGGGFQSRGGYGGGGGYRGGAGGFRGGGRR